MDLPRTWPALAFFANTGPFYSQLLTMLETYAVFRPDIGYVQGMSYVGGMLLLHMGKNLLFFTGSQFYRTVSSFC